MKKLAELIGLPEASERLEDLYDRDKATAAGGFLERVSARKSSAITLSYHSTV